MCECGVCECGVCVGCEYGVCVGGDMCGLFACSASYVNLLDLHFHFSPLNMMSSQTAKMNSSQDPSLCLYASKCMWV